MANRSIEDLYSALFAIQEAVQDATQLASEASNIAGLFGGEISRVVTEQLNNYFIPTVAKYAEDPNTPGSIAPLITFLDSVPLAMTREEPNPAVNAPTPVIPENPSLATPPVEPPEAPAEGSFADQTQQQEDREVRAKALQEMSHHPIDDIYDEFYELLDRYEDPAVAAKKCCRSFPGLTISDIEMIIDGDYNYEELSGNVDPIDDVGWNPIDVD